MKLKKSLLSNEIFMYLVFGVLATLVYMLSRTIIFTFCHQATLSAVIASFISIIFAFFTNDRFVFRQVPEGWWGRLCKFFLARLSTLLLDAALAFLFVQKFPNIIGQFVGNNLDLVNGIETIISQVLIIVLNYVFSKLLVFKDKK
ncbi:GtrA family protein [Streptococcus caballi]|uniref:GtrA family protein n=1 Tax=Streptococcus caballi TaxID=439220 RepID=UPI0003634687|nr:GtrA family protein [Streptococcus caballi]